MSAAAVIIGALIAAVGTGVSAGMQSKAQRDSMSESKRLAYMQRGDVLDANEKSEKLARDQMARGERQYMEGLKFQKEEAALSRGERREALSGQRKKEVYGNALALLNTNMALRQNQSKYWGR